MEYIKYSELEPYINSLRIENILKNGKINIKSFFEDFDWREVFKYVKNIEAIFPEKDKINITPFTIEDIQEIIFFIEGENDGEDWMVIGLLKDGRYFRLVAGCDYTGWG